MAQAAPSQGNPTITAFCDTILEVPRSPGVTTESSPTGLPPQAAAAVTFSTIDAPDPVVLEAETKILQRHNPLPRVVTEAALPQDVRPTNILHYSKTSIRSRYCRPIPSQKGTINPLKSHLPVLGDCFTTEVRIFPVGTPFLG